MKKIISTLLIFALLFSSFQIMQKKDAYAAETTPKLKYHLDMGVYVVAYVGGKWTNNISYGSTQPYTANLSFNNDIKVKRVMTLTQAKNEGIDVWNKEVCSNNLPLNQYKTAEDSYKYTYSNWVSPTITDFKIASGNGNKIKYTFNTLLQSKNIAGFDLIKVYESKREPVQIVESVVVKNNSLLETIKDLEAEKAELWPIVSRISNSGASEAEKQAFKRYQTISKQLLALYAKPTETTKERIITSYKRDVQGFIDSVFIFWGGEQGLYNENRSLYTLLKNMSAMKDVNTNDKYYLVFLPTVIEYEETAPVEDTPPPVLIPDTTGSCKGTIQWSETKSHTYTTGSGEHKVTHTCNHRYYYEAKLTSTGTLTADKPNGNSTTFKSGYGFKVTMNNTVSVKQINDNGSCGSHKTKSNSKTVTPPSAAEVRTNWTVINKEKKTKQNTVIKLSSSGSGSFVTAANPVSNYNKALIYTDVSLAGTRQKPVKHNISVYAYGGGVNGVQFCNTLNLSFTINGNMYEDDSTSDRSN
jgi:hypothetical protein